MIEIETNQMLLGATTTISKDQVVKDLLERGRQEPASSCDDDLDHIREAPVGCIYGESLPKLVVDGYWVFFEELANCGCFDSGNPSTVMMP